MAVNRFVEWQRAQGFEGEPLQVVEVHRDASHIRVVYRSTGQGEWQQELSPLAQQLSKDFGESVEFVGSETFLTSPIDAIRHAIGPTLSAMLSDQPIEILDSHIVIRFSNSLALTVFEKWGGAGRLKREVDALERYVIDTEVLDMAPPTPDEPVAVGPPLMQKKIEESIGRPVDVTKAISLDRIPSGGDIVVAGEVVTQSYRESRDGSRHFTWTITDDIGAIRAKFTERRGSRRYADDLWSAGSFVALRGTLEVDKFTEEQVMRVKDGAPSTPPVRFAPDDRPRIELHAHSKMSAMDALVSARDLYEGASAAAMKGLAILDHGVLQTYPEAETLGKKTGVRPIYGVEVNMVDTVVTPLTGPHATEWMNKSWVVFDVETTGLSPRSHQVLELGAVRVVDGVVKETFHRLIRPERSISSETTRITGIKAEELVDGISQEILYREFSEFVADSVLVAHNARFDLGYLRAGIDKYLPERPFDPVVLDTLTLARAVFPGLKSYGLGPLTDHFKISLTQHHRALADAEATAYLALRLVRELQSRQPGLAVGEAMEVSHTVGRPIPVVLLIKNQAGVKELYRLVSESHLNYFHRVPRIPRQMIESGREFWLVGSPFHGGEVADALFRNASSSERDAIARFYDYWEIVPPTAAQGLSAEGLLDGDDAVKAYIEDLITWGQEAGRPVPAVSDAHYLLPHHHIYREILAATAKGELHDRHDNLHLRSAREMHEDFGFLSDDRRESVIYTAPECVLDALEEVQPVPTGLFSPKLPEAEKVVSEEPYRRAEALYGTPLPEVVRARLQKEVQSIVSNGFSSIYYIAHRLVQKSLDDGYLVGSRGSVGSSLVATFLNITEVNPLPPHYRCPSCQWSEFVSDGTVGSGFDLPAKACPQCQTDLIGDGQDIPFETFLGFEGDKVPDIDLNFSGEYQPEIHRYTEVLFGKGHVFRAGTIATIAEKTAFGLVKAWERETGRELSPAAVDWLAAGITGVKRTTGQHPGGLMVVPIDEDVYRFTPVQRPADDKTSDVVTTHFDYHAIEGRLLKLDLLGHDDPTAIRMLEDVTGIKANEVPFQDPATMSLFSDVKALGVRQEDIGTSVGSLGIPEFGTRFVRQMLVETRPQSFAELVRISGLSHGTEVWTNNAQDLIRDKVATLSEVIATRDDIMTYLLQKEIPPKQAFAISEAVRKGKGLHPDQEALMKAHQVPLWYIESCRHISYLFPKAHAAAYVMMGWRIAWFKVHHPLAYYATYFSVRAGDFDSEPVLKGLSGVNQALRAIEDKGNEASPKEKGMVTVLEIAREMLARGLQFYPIDLDRSSAARFTIEGNGLLIPFAALPGLGVSAAEKIIEARQESPFLSIDDLRQRARLSRSVIDLLKAHGALGDLGETSQLGFF